MHKLKRLTIDKNVTGVTGVEVAPVGFARSASFSRDEAQPLSVCWQDELHSSKVKFDRYQASLALHLLYLSDNLILVFKITCHLLNFAIQRTLHPCSI